MVVKETCWSHRSALLLGQAGTRQVQYSREFSGGKIFVVEHWSTNILLTNEATLPTFTYSASSNHENNNILELTKYCSTTNVLTPENYPLYGTCANIF